MYMVNHHTGEVYRSPSDSGEPIDYGYLGRLSRPDGRGTFQYLAGIHAMGNLGGGPVLGRPPGRVVPRGEDPPVLPAGGLPLRPFHPGGHGGGGTDAGLPRRGRGLMRVTTASESGNPKTLNEDWALATEGLIVVLDGATARTDTGCLHGVAWYAAKLGAALAGLAADRDTPLGMVLAEAIRHTAGQHPGCDLTHPGTPSAAVATVRITADVVQYLVLGDVTVVVDTHEGMQVITDDRVSATAQTERREADRYPFGSAEKQAALLRMKHAELAARNQPGGYWVAADNPAVTIHAIHGTFPLDQVRRVAVLTDGAARIVDPFALLDWPAVLDLLDKAGPTELIRRVRAIEAADPTCTRWPRNKTSDDATAAYAA